LEFGTGQELERQFLGKSQFFEGGRFTLYILVCFELLLAESRMLEHFWAVQSGFMHTILHLSHDSHLLQRLRLKAALKKGSRLCVIPARRLWNSKLIQKIN
jgi:hypothetical protein